MHGTADMFIRNKTVRANRGKLLRVWLLAQVKAATEAHPTGDAAQQQAAGSQSVCGGVMGGNAAYNNKMEEHLKEQQAQLEQAQQALAAAQQAESQIR